MSQKVYVSHSETLVPGHGGGADWLQEHIRDGYLPAWSNPVHTTLDTAAVPNPDPLEGPYLQDAGMRVKALSRWNNYCERNSLSIETVESCMQSHL